MNLFPLTARRPDGVVATTLGPGRVTVAAVERFFRDVGVLRPERWLIDASGATSYDVGAIRIGATGLRALRESGLRRVVAIVISPMVRMGASVVSLSAGVPFLLVGSKAEAETSLAGA